MSPVFTRKTFSVVATIVICLLQITSAHASLHTPSFGPDISSLTDLSNIHSPMVNVNGTLFFVGEESDGINERELWKSNGTAAGTMMVKDIRPGSESSYPEHLTAVGNTLYFSADDGALGEELWKSDGTEAGTVIVKDINPGSGDSAPQRLVTVGNIIYFIATDGVHFLELWKSDGTAAGTIRVFDGNSDPFNIFNMTALGNMLYFSAEDGVNGAELWKSDGTDAGTVMVKDINPGSASSSPEQLTIMGNAIFFCAEDVEHGGYSLWRSDGTAVGTVFVHECANPVVMGNLLFLFSDGSPGQGLELWKSDGTEEGTVFLKRLDPEVLDISSTPPTVMGDQLYFRGYSEANGYELWKSDGTEVGTVIVKDMLPGSLSSYPRDLTPAANILFFVAEASKREDHNEELWRSDGTAAGTYLVKDVNPGVQTSQMDYLTAVGSTLYFYAFRSGSGHDLWRSNGTADGTLPVSEIDSLPYNFGLFLPNVEKVE